MAEINYNPLENRNNTPSFADALTAHCSKLPYHITVDNEVMKTNCVLMSHDIDIVIDSVSKFDPMLENELDFKIATAHLEGVVECTKATGNTIDFSKFIESISKEWAILEVAVMPPDTTAVYDMDTHVLTFNQLNMLRDINFYVVFARYDEKLFELRN